MQSEELVALRDESVASQNQEIDLAKFKILSIAVVGAIAIGVDSTNDFVSRSIPLVIGLIPPVAFYIDVIMETKRIQVMAIGAFLSTLDPARSALSKYEAYCQRHRNFFMTNFSYKYSTMVISGVIALLGLGRIVAGNLIEGYSPDPWLVAVEITSGLFGVIATVLLKRDVEKRISAFFDAVKKEAGETTRRRAAEKKASPTSV
jgi:hypothetical protein